MDNILNCTDKKSSSLQMQMHEYQKLKMGAQGSTEIQHEIVRRNRLFKRYRKNRTNNLWVAYKQQGIKITSLKRKGIKEFCKMQHLMRNTLGSSGKQWSHYSLARPCLNRTAWL